METRLQILRTILVNLVTLCAVVGCASYPEPDEYRALLSSTDVALDDRFEDLMYQDIDAAKKVKLELGGSRRSADFGGGKTFYEAFRIPDQGDFELQLSSTFTGFQQAFEHITVPTILLLDAAHHEVYRSVSDMVQGRGGSGTLFKHSMEVPRDAKYLVVYVDPALHNTRHPWHFNLFVATRTVTASASDPDSQAVVGLGGPIEILFRAIEIR